MATISQLKIKINVDPPHLACRPNDVWFALDKRGKITATWYRECVQPFAKWADACRNIGAVEFKMRMVLL